MTKLKKITILSIPILIVAGSMLTVFSISKVNKNKQEEKDIVNTTTSSSQDSNDIYTDVKIFPEIDPNNFYSYLRMNNKGTDPVINDDMVLFIVKYIIKNMNVYSGTISWGFKRESESKVDIQIVWKHNYNEKEYSYSHTYSFSALNYI